MKDVDFDTAERAVLGTILSQGDLSIARDLSSDAFLNSQNELIFEIILALHQSGQSVTIDNICAHLRIRNLTDGVPFVRNVLASYKTNQEQFEGYVNQLKERAPKLKIQKQVGKMYGQ